MRHERDEENSRTNRAQCDYCGCELNENRCDKPRQLFVCTQCAYDNEPAAWDEEDILNHDTTMNS